MTSYHRYPPEALRGDYLRAGTGAALCGLPLPFLHATPVALVILGSLTALFLFFGWRTWVRQGSVLQLDATGLTASGRVTLAWAEIQRIRLRYFSTRRDRRDGWMQLQLGGTGGTITVDSHIQDFETIAARAHAAARANGIAMTGATGNNFAALGLEDGAGNAATRSWGRPATWTE